MARKAPKENALVRIELGCAGLLGLTIISFCIFLWMYLFGVWTGQSGLQSTLATGDPREIVNTATQLLKAKQSMLDVKGAGVSTEGGGVTAPPETPLDAGVQANPPPVANKGAAKTKDENSGSFFAIQVAAYREEQKALKAVAQWRVREYEAFYLQPEPDGNFYRVLIGRFDSLAEANTLASQLESSEQNKVFISLVSESQRRYPASP